MQLYDKKYSRCLDMRSARITTFKVEYEVFYFILYFSMYEVKLLFKNLCTLIVKLYEDLLLPKKILHFRF